MHRIRITNEAGWIRLGIFLANHIPPAMGFWLSDRIGAFISSQKKSPKVRSVRANQWVISECTLSTVELNNRVRAVFSETSHCLYDLYRLLEDPQKIAEKVTLSTETAAAFKRLEQGKATIFVAPHLSNFDIIGQALAIKGYHFQVLSYPNPGKGYQFQNELRNKRGLRLTPMSLKALKEARETLRSGGSILTGLDRPVENSKYKPAFFNRPACLPVTHIKLALDEKVPVCVVAGRTIEKGQYKLLCSDLIKLTPNDSLLVEMIDNAETVLRVAEDFIRQAPEQWSMFYPVWPETVMLTP